MRMEIGGIASMLNQGTTTNSTQKSDSLKNSVNGLSSSSTEEELKEVLRDFESYICNETLCTSLQIVDKVENATILELDDVKVNVKIQKQ